MCSRARCAPSLCLISAGFVIFTSYFVTSVMRENESKAMCCEGGAGRYYVLNERNEKKQEEHNPGKQTPINAAKAK